MLDLEVHVVTRLYGGSALAREVEADHPVSAKSVRGNLRYWWRACRAGAYATSEELALAEAAIWGAAGTGKSGGPSAIDIEVETVVPGTVQPTRDDRNDVITYATFPFQRDNTQDAASYLADTTFRVRAYISRSVRSDNALLQRELESAVWAWASFGGVGARTRRGCGAIYIDDSRFSPPATGVMDWLEESAGSYVERTHSHPQITSLAGTTYCVGEPSAQARSAWITALDVIRDVRKGWIGKQDGPRSTKTKWPEASSIRQASNERPAYPRADLGLPIIFQNVIGKTSVTLQGIDDKRTRMASPVITKPLLLRNGAAVPLVAVLQSPHIWDPDSPKVGFKDRDRPIDHNMLDVSSYWSEIVPLRQIGASSVRDAVMKHAEARLESARGRL